MQAIKYLMEKRMFGVCAYLGDKMGISSERIRMYFIYLSCITLISPFILYLFVAFWMNVKNYVREGRTSVWDL